MPEPPESRREAVPFDPYHFEREARAGRRYAVEDAFRLIYQTNHWSAPDRSGEGASLSQTAWVLQQLTRLLESLPVRTLLDLPCGDFSWMQHLPMDAVRYIGADVLPELVESNRRRWETPARRFITLDLIRDPLPPADLLLCRDCLVHLSKADISSALRNIRRSGIQWLLTTTFPGCDANDDIVTGDWRPLNLQLPPFSLPAPRELVDERCTEGGGAFADKSLALWHIDDLDPMARPPVNQDGSRT